MHAMPFPSDEGTRLAGLARLQEYVPEPPPALTALTALAAQVAGMPRAGLSFVRCCETHFVCSVGAPLPDVPRAASPCAHVVASRAAVCLPDRSPQGLRTRWRAYAGFPVVVPGSATVCGALCVFDDVPRQLDPRQRALLAALADQAGHILATQVALASTALALRESRDRFDAFMAATNIVAWTKTAAGRMIYANPTLRRLFSLREADVYGRLDHEWLPADCAVHTTAADRRVLARWQPEEIRETTRTRAGAMHEWVSYKFPLRSRDGDFVGGIAVDHSTERRTERALQASRRDFERVVEGISEVVFELDADARFTYLNGAWEALTHLPVAATIGRELFAHLPATAATQQRRAFSALLRGQRPSVRDTVRLQLGGRRSRWVVLQYCRLDGPAGGAASGIVGTMLDVTDRMRAERAALRARKLLRRRVRARTRELSAIVHGIPQMVWRACPRGRPTWFNPQWERFTGLALDGWARRPRAVLRSVVHPEDLRGALHAWHESLRGTTNMARQVRLRRVDGTYHWFLVDIVAVRNTGGQALNWYGSCTDIDDQKQSQALLEQRVRERTRSLTAQAQKLTRSNQELERFAYGISHDLREPLRMVTSFASLLQRKHAERMDAEALRFLGFMVEGACRMQQFINDLLSYSRIGRDTRPPRPVPLEDVLAGVRRNLHAALAEGGGHILAPEPLPALLGTPVLFVQLLQNLCGNALKFRRPQVPPRVEVRVSCDCRPGFVLLTVADNGIGIESAFLDRIFVVFQRLHSRDAFEGSGIGLAVCKKIVEQVGGAIWATSTVGVGTTFHILWPQTLRTRS